MDDLSRLCTHCGLCCDGRLFDDARIAEGEEPVVRAAGLEVVQGNDGRLAFQQPCHFLSDGCCTRYETRFQVCRSFKCALLRGVQRGEIAPARAMAVVDEAKRLLDRAAHHLDGPAICSARRAKMRELQELESGADKPARRAYASARLDLVAVRLFLDRHFRRRDREVPKSDSPDG
ncbi:YkgJ family cysteine cluster protein [Sphingomonas sp. CCH9-H8]|nr:YkgJ family cysteine cluster protein [Sphingomonas sp. CCH9-H8]